MQLAGIRRLSAFAAASVALLAAPVAASAATVANGDFETGSLSGWQTENVNPPGSWFAYTGTTPPLTPLPPGTVQAPPQGNWAAIVDQSGPGRHILYQDISLQPGVAQELSLIVYYNSNAAIAAPASLDPTVVPNQQYRIDVLRPSAPIASVAPADILLEVFRTKNGDTTTLAPTRIGANLAPFAGQTVRLRFAEVDNQGNFWAGADAVSVKAQNSFTLGKPKLNKKKGTATITAKVPNPGKLTGSGKGVKVAGAAVISKKVSAAGKVKLTIKAKGKQKRTLNETGKVKLKPKITYTPTGGDPSTQSIKVKLKKTL